MRVMNDEWADYADGWDADEAARAYAAAAFTSLQSILADTSVVLDGATVVDFGCGTGLLTERLVEAGAAVIAIDTSAAMLKVLDAKVAARGWSEVTTTGQLADAPGNVELIVCSSVCSFLDDYPATARELAGLLRPGGVFVQWDWERSDDHPGLTRDEIATALTAAGLEQVVVDVGFEAAVGDMTMRPLVGHGTAPTG
jgi:2-polyprenyl-3-methyl-5-hydroxy-6-metoxy-1,4-benzoquinol methylase